MPLEKEYITTEADRLLALLQQRREISIEEAAKALNMAIKTVESYANFFEEEGLIGINYKFTTPYLTIKEAKAAAPEIKFSIEPEKRGVGDILLRKVGEDLDILKMKLRSGELYLLKEKYPLIIKNLREILKSSESGVPIRKTQEMEVSLTDINEKFIEALRNLNENHADSARSDFFFIENGIENLYEKLSGKPETNFSGTSETKGDLPEPVKTTEFNSLVEEIKATMKKGDFEQGQALLKQLHTAYKNLPGEYREKEEKLKRDLKVLERDITLGQTEHLSHIMEDKSVRIRHFILAANKALEKKVLPEAIGHFNRIKELYSELPKGFVQDRIALNREIIGLFRKINTSRSEVLDESFVEISTKMEESLTQIREHLAQNKFNDAIQAYNEAVELFSKLPDIKTPVKNNLKNYLLLVYERLSAAKEQYFSNNLKSVIAEIYRELGRAQSCLDHKDFKTTNLHYSAALTTFKTIPRGYTEMLLPVHEKLMEFYQKLSLQVEQQSSAEFETASFTLNAEMDRLDKLVQEKFYEDALGIFQRVMIMFNRLPGGFIKEKAALKKRLTILSDSITGEIDDIVLKGVPPEVREAYHELLRYIALFFMHVESHRFNLVSIDYRQIKRLVDRLPYGLITGSKLITKELKEISGEVEIIGQIKQLSQLVELGYSTKAKELFALMVAKIERLDRGRPQVRGLYSYIKKLMEKKPKKVLLLSNNELLPSEPMPNKLMPNKLMPSKILQNEFMPQERPMIEPLPKQNTTEEEAVPLIQPLTGNEEQDLIRIANRKEQGKHSDEFEKLKGVLQREIISNIASRKKEMVINNKISMAKMFLEFGKKERAREILREALAFDPENKSAKMLQAMAGGQA